MGGCAIPLKIQDFFAKEENGDGCWGGSSPSPSPFQKPLAYGIVLLQRQPACSLAFCLPRLSLPPLSQVLAGVHHALGTGGQR